MRLLINLLPAHQINGTLHHNKEKYHTAKRKLTVPVGNSPITQLLRDCFMRITVGSIYQSKALFKGWVAHHKIIILLTGHLAINLNSSAYVKLSNAR